MPSTEDKDIARLFREVAPIQRDCAKPSSTPSAATNKPATPSPNGAMVKWSGSLPKKSMSPVTNADDVVSSRQSAQDHTFAPASQSSRVIEVRLEPSVHPVAAAPGASISSSSESMTNPSHSHPARHTAFGSTACFELAHPFSWQTSIVCCASNPPSSPLADFFRLGSQSP